MENINNIPFSFDRNTSKWIAKLGTSHTESSFADGITLSNVLINDKSDFDKGSVVDKFDMKIPYVTKTGETKYMYYDEELKEYPKVPFDMQKKFIGILSLSNRVLPDQTTFYQVDYSLERDNYNNHKLFTIKEIEGIRLPNGNYEQKILVPSDGKFAGQEVKIYGLYFNDGDDEYRKVYYSNGQEFNLVTLGSEDKNVYLYEVLYSPEALYS
jgi:hypothetical protein